MDKYPKNKKCISIKHIHTFINAKLFMAVNKKKNYKLLIAYDF